MSDYKRKSVKKVRAVKPRAKTKIAEKAAVPDSIYMKKAPGRPNRPVKQREKRESAPADTAAVKNHPLTNSPLRDKTVRHFSNKPAKMTFNVIRGRKTELSMKKLRTLIAFIAVISSVIIISAITPTGLIEYSQNIYKAMGSGSFPKEISGNQVINCEYDNSKLYVLSDTSYSVYNTMGKTVLSDTHGFSAPIMKTSAARTLVLDQNGTGYKIYNLSEALVDKVSDETIITGDICKKGSYALVTKPSNYASKVEVFNKNGKSVFTWSSSKEIVTSVCLSNSGKRLAVSVFYSNAGEYVSKVYVFSFKSAAPLLTAEYNQPVLYLRTLSGSSFAAVTSNSIDFIKWRKLTRTTIDTKGAVLYFRRISGSIYCVACESSRNNLDTQFIIYNNKFETVKDMIFEGSADDITYCNGSVYCLDDNYVYRLADNGKTAWSAECGYSVRRLFVKSSDASLIITDSEIRKIDMEG